MSDDSSRPAKRVRLDDSLASTPSTATSAQLFPAVPTLGASATIDADLEREVRAGITEYVCPDNLGFTGVLKQRYTDFLVNEIGLDGQVLHLTSTAVKDKKKVDQGIRVANGAEKQTIEGAVVEEQKPDADMENAGLGGEVTLQVPAAAAPQIPENNGASAPDQPETINEDSEEQVSKLRGSVVHQKLTVRKVGRRRSQHTAFHIRRANHGRYYQACTPSTQTRIKEGKRLQGRHITTHNQQGLAHSSSPESASHIPEFARERHGE